MTADSADADGVPTDSNINERMRIAVGGNVGIGTPSPAANLHVYSAGQAIARVEGVNQYYSGLMIKNNYSSTQSQWHVAAAGGTSGWGAVNGNFIIRDDTTNSTGIEIERGAGGATGALYIDSDGKVGVSGKLGVGSGTAESQIFNQATTISGTNITSIVTDIAPGMSSAAAAQVIIYGSNNAGNAFMDVVHVMKSQSVVVLQSSTLDGGPHGRTYAVAGAVLRVTMDSGASGYQVNCHVTSMEYPF
jgi:hypothetical protein